MILICFWAENCIPKFILLSNKAYRYTLTLSLIPDSENENNILFPYKIKKFYIRYSLNSTVFCGLLHSYIIFQQLLLQ